MKISKLFHWLYASVMFLPLIIMPIFAIYSHRHTIDNYSIEVAKKEVVDFNQNVPNEYVEFNGDAWIDYEPLFVISGNIGDVYYIKFVPSIDYNDNFTFYLYSSLGLYQRVYNGLYTVNYEEFAFAYNDNGVDYFYGYINIFNLSKMFGYGNEPSQVEFDSLFSQPYYDYTLSKDILITNGSVVYDDTDIGSQFLYCLYNSTDKYLNFDEVLSLGAISDWIELNVFNGNAPLVYTIVWHYLDYWLILSIFWLCFDVLIYVPQIAHRWLDKASLE